MDFLKNFPGGINFLTNNINSEKVRPPPVWLKNRIAHNTKQHTNPFVCLHEIVML